MKQREVLSLKSQVAHVAVAPGGGLAAVDWKGTLYLRAAEGERLTAHALHKERAQAVAAVPGGYVTVAWDGLCSVGPDGEERDRWSIPVKGRGFHRGWFVATAGSHLAVDIQRGAKSELWFGTVDGDGNIAMESAARRSAPHSLQLPRRIAGSDAEAVYWRAKGKLVRVPFAKGKGKTAATLEERHAHWSPAGTVHVVDDGDERTLRLAEASVPLPIPSDFYPMALGRERVAVGTSEGTLWVFSWAGAVLAEGKHRQCSGLAWDDEGRLVSWGWDKKIRLWPPV